MPAPVTLTMAADRVSTNRRRHAKVVLPPEVPHVPQHRTPAPHPHDSCRQPNPRQLDRPYTYTYYCMCPKNT